MTEVECGEIGGHVAPGFQAVREAFKRNFVDHGEVGAACCVYVGGRPVVDIWGGVADASTDRPWSEDTIQLVFSATKGATAICANLLAERGDLDVDAPVADYWPEFGQAGKEAIPVRWLLSHEAGLPAFDQVVTAAEAYRWGPVVDALAVQQPLWDPGTAHGYHAVTFGWLVGEVIRRVTGATVGSFFAKEVAEPLGLEMWIGLPEELESRVAPLIGMGAAGPSSGRSSPADAEPPGLANLDPSMLLVRALQPVTGLSGAFNSRELHAAELPAANGIGTARSLARMYAAVIGEVDGAEGGSNDKGGIRLLRPETVARATTTTSRGPDRVLFVETHFGLGFMLPSAFCPMGGAASFGHPGAGGALGFADPDAGMAFGYVMNRMQMNLAGDPRNQALIEAVYSSLASC